MVQLNQKPPNAKTKQTHKKLNLNLNQHSTSKTAHMCSRITVHNCCKLHNTAQNSSDDFPSYPPDKHHSADDVYWRGISIIHHNPAYCNSHTTSILKSHINCLQQIQNCLAPC